MGKSLYIAEKPSVAQEFAKALHINTQRKDGYLESAEAIVTWCVGHLVTMSYPEEYDPALKRWSLETLPFIPQEFKYEVIPAVSKQFRIVSGLLNRTDVDTIYVCTDSGREGEYIYRLVEQQAGVKGKNRRRVWIDSQTEEEILRGIKEAKDLKEYDNLAASAYLRAKEDYLMGINFSRLLTLKYGNSISNYLNTKYSVVSVGRVMTCVLGMVVRREREIREFVETPFYRVLSTIGEKGATFEGEWRAVKGSKWFESFDLYKENGFKEKEKAEELIRYLSNSESAASQPLTCQIVSIEKKKEKKNPPLLFNLAEIQNECSKRFKISPDETLRIIQELYEKKLVTYPRTDARVLSTAVAKEIHKNLNGLMQYEPAKPYLQDIVKFGSHKGLEKTRYVNDKQITDHYAIIPTGQGMGALKGLPNLSQRVYDVIVRRFCVLRDKDLKPVIPEGFTRKKQYLIMAACSFVIGIYDGFYGPGTGTFLLLAFTKLGKLDMEKATGNVKVVNLTSNISALITFILAGKILWVLGLSASVFSIAGHYLGAHMVVKNGVKIIKPIILLVLALLLIKIVLGI